MRTLNLNLSDRLPFTPVGSQGSPVTGANAVEGAIEAQLMEIVYPTALLGIGKGFLSFLNPGSCADEGGCGNALCYSCYPE